jgi:pyrimidine-nucleoside phosphorylase/thymidine phosphorylase
MLLGAGRKTKEDPIDYAAGITLSKKIGDYVNLGDVLCQLHTNVVDVLEAEKQIRSAYRFSVQPPEALDYVIDIIS